jgi:hypothetical protein
MQIHQSRNAFFPFKVLSLITLYLPMTLLISGCGGSSGGNTFGTVISETIAIGDDAKDVQLTAGRLIEHKFTYTYPGDITSKGDYSFNMIKTLENVSLSASPIASDSSIIETLRLLALGVIKQAFAAEQSAQVTVHISYAGDRDVCSSPYIGSDSILGAIGSPLTGSKTMVQPTQEAVDIINAGIFEVCVVTTPPVSGYVTLSGVVVDFESCEDSGIDITGAWSGTYQCTNFGTGNDGGAVSLTITPNNDGSYHYIDDGGAAYDGHLCGNKFKYRGGVDGVYTENGTLVFADATHATKTSYWVSDSLNSGGNCSDVLQKGI